MQEHFDDHGITERDAPRLSAVREVVFVAVAGEQAVVTAGVRQAERAPDRMVIDFQEFDEAPTRGKADLGVQRPIVIAGNIDKA